MDTAERFAALAAADPHQMSEREYRAIAAELQRRRGCNLIVFGCGNDSPLWVDLNRGGFTLFVEDSEAWAVRTAAALPPGAWEIQRHDYGTRVSDGAEAVGNGLPEWVRAMRWDVLVIDGPAGNAPDAPGRAIPIRAALTLPKRAGWVAFVHDCDRELEQTACYLYLGEPAARYDRTFVYGAAHERPL